MTIPGDENVTPALVRQLEREEIALAELRLDFPGYAINRGRRHGVSASWVAGLRNAEVGVGPTIITSTAATLRAALEDQCRRAQAGEKPLVVKGRP
ncbi:hypothetical protein [Actinomadura hibisca]|uniref:hypothetical protein n=1 Tax=Actinomadura hibisca TaxID=68565 RepID=UPI00083555D9|nr:hypothetical protein [Actinomadura hibisca]